MCASSEKRKYITDILNIIEHFNGLYGKIIWRSTLVCIKQIISTRLASILNTILIRSIIVFNKYRPIPLVFFYKYSSILIEHKYGPNKYGILNECLNQLCCVYSQCTSTLV